MLTKKHAGRTLKMFSNALIILTLMLSLVSAAIVSTAIPAYAEAIPPGDKLITPYNSFVKIVYASSDCTKVNKFGYLNPPGNEEWNKIQIGRTDSTSIGTARELGNIAAGQELVLYVESGICDWYSGPGTRNTDGNAHAKIEKINDGLYRVSFEDTNVNDGDKDYNDVVMEVYFIKPTASVSVAKAADGTVGEPSVNAGTVTLSRAFSWPVTVTVAASGGTAEYGSDYALGTSGSADSSSLTFDFPAGTTSRPFEVRAKDDHTYSNPNEFFNVYVASTSSNAIANPALVPVAIKEKDAIPAVRFDQATYTVNEPATGANTNVPFTIILSEPCDFDTVVSIGTVPGSATAGTDYQASVGNVMIPAGANSASGFVTVVGDGMYSTPDQTFSIRITGADHGLGIGTPGQATVTIKESTISGPIPPRVQFDKDSYSANEPASGMTGSMPFTVTLTEPCDFPVTVTLATVPGTAAPGTNYNPAVASVTIPAGASSKSGSVTIIGDGLYSSPDQTFDLQITGVDSRVVKGTPDQAKMTINEYTSATNPIPPAVQLEQTAYLVNEPAAGATADVAFKVTLTEACDFPVTVTMGTVAGTAVAGDDYVATIDSIVIPAGQAFATGKVTVKGDGRYSPADQAFKIQITSVTSPLVIGTQKEATVTIKQATTPGSLPPTVQFDRSAYSVNEPASGVTATMPFLITLSEPCDFPVTVSVGTVAGSAKADTDYVPTVGNVVIPAGTTSFGGIVTVKGDGLYSSPDKSFGITITGVDTPLGIGTQKDATVTIIETAPAGEPIPPTVKLGAIAYTINEPASGVTAGMPFTVIISEPCDFPVTVTMEAIAGSAIAGEDYNPAVASVVIPVGASSATGSVIVKGDGLYSSPDQMFTIRIASVSTPLGIGTPNQAIVTINEYSSTSDPIPPTVQLNKSAYSVNEPAAGASVAVPFKVTLTEPCDFPVTITMETVAGTAVAGDDFVALVNPVTIPAGASSAEGSVTVNGDGRYSLANQAFKIQITSVTGPLGIGTPKNATVTILEATTPGPSAPTVQLNQSAYSIKEPAKGLTTEMPFAVTLSKPCDFPVTVTLSTFKISAAAGTNYQAAVAQVIIPAGASSMDGTVTIIGDGIYSHPDNTFGLQIDSADPALCIGVPGNAEVTINEYSSSTEPIPPTVQFNPATYTVDEPAAFGHTNVPFTVTLSEPCAFPVTVFVSTVPGTAVAIDDYDFLVLPVTIPAGQHSATGIVVVKGDGRYSPVDSSFKLRIDTVSLFVAIGSPREATVTIREATSAAPTVQLNQSAYIVPEPANGGSIFSMPFSVILSKPCDHPVTVNVAASGGSAIAGTDYDGAIAPVVIPAGATSAPGSITIIGDGLYSSPDKYFNIEISVDSPVTVVDPYQATVTITETAPTGETTPPTVKLASSTYDVVEPAVGTTTDMPFTVRITEPCDFDVIVTMEALDGTAVADNDYVPTIASVTIPAKAATADGFVTVKGDGTYNPLAKTFSIKIKSVDHSLAPGTPDQATVTINNCDPKPVVSLNKSIYDAPEGGTGYVNITLAGNASEPVIVYYTLNGIPGSVTFDPATDGSFVLIPVNAPNQPGIQTGITLSFTIDGVSPNAVLGAPAGATINVVELETTYTVHLKQGWNMISSPLVIRPFMASQINQLCPAISQVMQYDIPNGTFSAYVMDFSPDRYDFEVRTDVGYLVYADEDTVITFVGCEPEDRSITINPGWAMVGWSTRNTSYAKIVTSIITPGDQQIMMYDNPNTTFTAFVENFSPDRYNFRMAPGGGYLIYTDNTVTLNYGGILNNV